MRLKQFSLYIICFFLILQSCTVEKRLHKRGYYVEWKSFRKVENKKLERTTLSNTEGATQVTDEIEREVFIETKLESTTEKAFIDEGSLSTKGTKTSTSQKVKINPKTVTIQVVKKHHFKEASKKYRLGKKPKDNGKTQNRLATIGYILAITSIFIGFTVLPSLYINAVALRQISKNPNRYTNKNRALIGYIISAILVSLYFFIFGLLLSAFVFGSIIPALYFGCVYLGILVSSLIIINT